MMVLAGPGSLQRLQGRTPSLPLQASGCCWQSLTSFSLCRHNPDSIFTWSSTGLSITFSILIRTLDTSPWVYLGAHPNLVWPHLNLITSAKILFPNKVTFIGIGGEDFNIAFWGEHNPTHNRGYQALKRGSSLTEDCVWEAVAPSSRTKPVYDNPTWIEMMEWPLWLHSPHPLMSCHPLAALN